MIQLWGGQSAPTQLASCKTAREGIDVSGDQGVYKMIPLHSLHGLRHAGVQLLDSVHGFVRMTWA
eukprot:CAMPEP_0204522474 /NCGR_PEP_ID=MMETSP0661-20131031/6341_1 /ASSEMBLY_ACC=CAM_ASM_000606 /TAXON_ID=109239 /ORGANISM="Alexandrium margalefi, Strain AMGDE01CS-322" /LENGTH=64 /DNA_ID=CAMNT_0051528143 /DNA_START=183 /DNA_END=373 /DNA_ORIENTATION=-